MKFRHIILALALAVGFASCSDDKDEPAGLGSDLTVRETMTLAADAPQELNIKARALPTLTSDADWLHVSGATLKGGASNIYVATVQADLNPTAHARSGKITVACGQETAIVTVTQRSGEVVEIVSIEPSGDLNPIGGKLTVKYTATSALTVTTPEWMTYSNDAAASELTLNYMANTGAARTGEVVLAINDKVKTSFTVSQGVTDLLLGKTAKEILGDMYAGINIGNTLEAPGSETGWVKTLINPTYIAGLKNLGFNAVRVPCAWDSHVSDPATNTIDPAWLDRVDEVIGYIVGNGMYAILNIHWDGGWLETSVATGWDSDVDKKQHDYWKQIAEKLNHYDQHLLFAAMNEPNHSSDTSTDAIMKYQQTMLDVVRATGGNNADRVLLMQGPNTNIDLTTAGRFHMPDDVIADRLGVEVHYYDTYQFNMMEKDENWGKMHYYWGEENFVSGSDRNSPHGPADVRVSMQKMKTAFFDKGIPGIIGEYAVCVNRDSYRDIDKAKWRASVRLWNVTVTREAKNAGMVPFFWEVSDDIDRTNGTIRRDYMIDGVLEGAAAGQYPL